MKTYILIETQECDYMTYFMEAGHALASIITEYSGISWTEEKIKADFIDLTQSFHRIIDGSDISKEEIERLTEDLILYVGKDLEKLNDLNREESNGSDVVMHIGRYFILSEK